MAEHQVTLDEAHRVAVSLIGEMMLRERLAMLRLAQVTAELGAREAREQPPPVEE